MNADVLKSKMFSTQDYKTIIDANKDGFRRYKQGEYGGEVVEVKGQRFYRKPKMARSQSAWKKAGYRIKADEQPHARCYGRQVGHYDVYRDDQVQRFTRPIAKAAVSLGTTAENILLSIFTVNRSAKRQRDGAKKSYNSRAHAMATHCKEIKERLYELKDRGIAHAYLEGWLTAEQHGELVLFSGGGYSFHSKLAPKDLDLAETNQRIAIEAKPKGKKEPRVKDAMATLEQLPDRTSQLDHLTTDW